MKFIFLISLFVSINALSFNVSLVPAGVPISADFTNLAVEFFGLRDLFLINSKIIDPIPLLEASQLPQRINYHVLQLLSHLSTVNTL